MGCPVDPFDGDGEPYTGGELVSVVNVYHFLVYNPLPEGSVAFTQILYVIPYASPDIDRVLVPFDALEPLVDCPLLH